MKRTVVWTLVGLIGFGALEPGAFHKLARALGFGDPREVQMLHQLLFAAAFAVMNAGYVAQIRGRRYFSLKGSALGPIARVAARPLTGWTRVELCVAPDHIAYVRELRRTPLAIALVAAAWAGVVGYSYHLAGAWWLSAGLLVLGIAHVLSMLARCVVLGSTHGTEDVLYGSAAQTAELRQQLRTLLGNQLGYQYTTRTWSVETATVLNRVPLTSTEQTQEIQWAMILLGVLGVVLAATSNAPALAVVGAALIVAGILLSRPASAARFEGGSSVPIPNTVYSEVQPGTAV